MREREAQSREFAKQLRRRMTDAEVKLWSLLRKHGLNGVKFRRQHPVGPFVTDFACVSARLVIEVDGDTHSTREELEYDAERTKFLEQRGWRVLRVMNRDVFENMDGVWLAIDRLLPPPAASPPPPPQAGEESGAQESKR